MTIFSSLSYLEKQRFAPRQISTPPAKDLEMVVVIPCFDEPQLLRTLNSLEGVEMPSVGVEVIIVVNSSIKSTTEIKERNQETIKDFDQWRKTQCGRRRHGRR